MKGKLGADEDRSGDHIYFFLTVGDKEHRVGKMSHSARGQVQDFVIGDTARRLRLRKGEFLQVVDCTIDKNGHRKLWVERGV